MSLLVNWSQAWSNVCKSRTLKSLLELCTLSIIIDWNFKFDEYTWNLTNTLWDNAKKLEGDLKRSKSCTYFSYENVEEH